MIEYYQCSVIIHIIILNRTIIHICSLLNSYARYRLNGWVCSRMCFSPIDCGFWFAPQGSWTIELHKWSSFCEGDDKRSSQIFCLMIFNTMEEQILLWCNWVNASRFHHKIGELRTGYTDVADRSHNSFPCLTGVIHDTCSYGNLAYFRSTKCPWTTLFCTFASCWNWRLAR